MAHLASLVRHTHTFVTKHGVPVPGTLFSGGLAALTDAILHVFGEAPASASAELTMNSSDLVGAIIAGTGDAQQQTELVSRSVKLGLPWSAAGKPAPTSVLFVVAAAASAAQAAASLPSADAAGRCLTHAASAAAAMGRAVALADAFWAALLDKAAAEREGRSIALSVLSELERAGRTMPAVLCLLHRGAPALARHAKDAGAAAQQLCLALAGRLVGCLGRVLGEPAEMGCSTEPHLDAAARSALSAAGLQAAAALLEHQKLQDGPGPPDGGAIFTLSAVYMELANQADASSATRGDTESGSNGDGSATQWLNDYLLRANLLLTQREGPRAPIEDLGALLARCSARQLVRAQSFALQWILTAAEQDQLAPGTRARALRSLGEVVTEAGAAQAGKHAVHAVVEASLTSEAPLVREAAVAVASALLCRAGDGIERWFESILLAARDVSPGVRKAAVRALVDGFLRPQRPDAVCKSSMDEEASTSAPGASEHSHETRAACQVVLRAADAEDGVRAAAAAALRDYLFAPPLAGGGGHPAAQGVDRSELGARRFASVAAAVRTAAGRAFQLPLAADHPLRRAVAGSVGGADAGALEGVAGALLRSALRVLSSAADEASGAAAALPSVLALHTLAEAERDARAAKKPAECAWSLAALPLDRLFAYLRDAEPPSADREGADFRLCVLTLVECAVEQRSRGARSASRLPRELPETLVSLVNRHPFVQVVGAACRALCALAQASAAASLAVSKLAAAYQGLLQALRADQGATHAGRFCYILGQLCRYGGRRALADGALDGVVAALRGVLDDAHRALPDRETALQSLLGLALAFPDVLDGPASPVATALAAGLHQTASLGLQARALGGLAALLEGAEADGARRGDAARAATLAQANGSEDSELSVRVSGALQAHWEDVLRLALTPAPRGDQATEAPVGAAEVRSRALAVMDVALRGGLVGPWTALPALVALAFDPRAETAARALRALEALARRHGAYVSSDRVVAGLRAAAATYAGVDAEDVDALEALVAVAAAGAEGLFTRLVAPHAQLRTTTVKTVLGHFEKAVAASEQGAAGGAGGIAAAGGVESGEPDVNECAPPSAPSKSTTSQASASDLRSTVFLASFLAHLPLRNGDEACRLLCESQRILALRGDAVVSRRGDRGDTAPHAAPRPAPGQLLPLAVLARLRAWLQRTHAVSDERVALYATGAAERRRAEERTALHGAGATAQLADLVPCDVLPGLVLGAAGGAEGAADAWVQVQKEVEEAILGAEQALEEQGWAGTPPGGTPSERAPPRASTQLASRGAKTAGTARRRPERRAREETPRATGYGATDAASLASRRQSARLASARPSSRLTRSLARVASDGSSEDESGSGSDDADWSPDLPRKRLRL